MRDRLLALQKEQLSTDSASVKTTASLTAVSLKEDILRIIRAEKVMAHQMYTLMLKWPEIGFEAANHYYFNIDAVMEKIVNLAYLEEYYT